MISLALVVREVKNHFTFSFVLNVKRNVCDMIELPCSWPEHKICSFTFSSIQIHNYLIIPGVSYTT